MDYRIVNDTQLYHYGVPGMKWGVRKSPVRTGTRRKRSSGMSEQTKTRLKRVAGTAAKVGLAVGVGMLYRNPQVRKATAGIAKSTIRNSKRQAARGKRAVARTAKKGAVVINSRRAPKILNPNSAKGAALLNRNAMYNYGSRMESLSSFNGKTLKEVRGVTDLGRVYITRIWQ